MGNLNEILPSQLIGMIMSTFFTMLLLLTLHYGVIKKQKNGHAPSNKIMVLLEVYYSSFSNLFTKVMSGKNLWSLPYLFSLFNFILINSLMPWIGLEAAPSSIMFTFPLTLITFITIYVIGIGTMGFWGFCRHKYSNPLELILQFSPLLSMSIRLFAATLAGGVIGDATWVVIGGICGPSSPVTYWFPALMGSWKWIWSLVDSAESGLQAFVFVMLTAIFWTMDTGPTWSSKERKRLKQEKALAANKDLQNLEKREKIHSDKEQTNVTVIKAKGVKNGRK